MSNSLEKTLLRIPYFHVFKSIEQVMNAMFPYLSSNGHFLVRPSLSKMDTLTVTVTDNCTVKHFNVQINNGFYHLSDKRFFSISELCSFYSRNDVPNAEGYVDIRLLYPIQNLTFKPQRQALPQPPTTLMHCPHSADCVNSNRSLGDLRRTKTCSNLKSQSLTIRNGDFVGPICYYKDLGGSSREELSDVLERCSEERRLRIRNNSDELWLPRKGSLTDPARKDLNDEMDTTKEQLKEQTAYYSFVRKREDNVLEDVLEQLRRMEEVDKCSCGLPLSETELCEGWSVHLSTESTSLGMVFFTSPSGSTSWKLPTKISRQLTPSQKDFIKLLKQKTSSTMMR